VLRIRKKEKAALAAAEERAYEEHLVSVLRAQWPAAFAELGEDAVRALVHAWVDDAEVHGVKLEKDVAHFVNIMFAVLTDFGEDPRRVPWVREVLQDPALTPTGIVYRLYAALYGAYDAKDR
jgi:hypothetical protein